MPKDNNLPPASDFAFLPVSRRGGASAVKYLLKEILKLGGEIFCQYFSVKYKGAALLTKREAQQLQIALLRLLDGGYIKVYKRSRQRIYKLTPLGRRYAIEQLIKTPYHISEPWDKRWRVIIFDVPEIKKARRARIRKYLTWASFRLLHKSVWISPWPIPRELNLLFKDDGLDRFSRMLTVEHINYDRDLRRYFKL